MTDPFRVRERAGDVLLTIYERQERIADRLNRKIERLNRRLTKIEERMGG